jgi:hydroxymethylpyrimidine pyrophosphatase-like HAD family hydrolase
VGDVRRLIAFDLDGTLIDSRITFPQERLSGHEWIVTTTGELRDVIDAFVTGSGIRDPGSGVRPC